MNRSRLSQFLNLLWALVSRDIRARYRRSTLGILWAVLQPLMLMLVFSILRGIVDIPSDGVPYVIFSYSALVPWTFFSQAVNNSGRSVMSNRDIIKKIGVPREVFPLASVLTAFFDMSMSGIVLVGMMVWYNAQISWTMLWVIPLLALTAVISFAIGMFVAAIGTFRQDIVLALPFIMQLWLYTTPIIYPISSVPEKWRNLYIMNPMVGIIEGFRGVLVKAQTPDMGQLTYATIVTVLALVIAWPFYRKMSGYFADVI